MQENWQFMPRSGIVVVAAVKEMSIIKNYQFSLYIFCQTDIINKCAKDNCSPWTDRPRFSCTEDIEIG